MSFPQTTTLLFLGLFSTYSAFASDDYNPVIQCPIPSFDKLSYQDINTDSQAITITSKYTQIEKNQFAKFTGGVTLVTPTEAIIADQIELNRQNLLINAEGNIHFQNTGIDVFASQLNASKAAGGTTLSDTSYQLTTNAGHGSAKTISVNQEGVLTLVDSSFTTCFGETPDWRINASEITINTADKQLEAYNAKFEVFDIPVFYIPYFTMPIGDERHSGILYPNIKTSSNSGFEVSVPYYWNIAENFDATITPRYMSERGTQLNTEFRYLMGHQSGVIDVEYLNRDIKLTQNEDPRYLARLQHVGTFSDRFRAYIDYTTISDDNYLIDLDSEQYNSNDAYLYQIGELSYFGDSWSATVKLQDFEILGNHTPSYQTEPHIELSKSQALPFANAVFNIYSEMTRFITEETDLPTAERYHVEAGITLPITRPAWFLNSEVKILQTTYRQDNIAATSLLEEKVSRTLPKVRIHGGMNFDKTLTFDDKNYTQTLEPQLQYLYIPNKDQNAIGLYDTTSLQDDFDGLFRDRRFSGLDRIAEANQYSWGLTTRILDPQSQERLRLSLGRIVFINTDDTLLSNDPDANIEVSESALATEVYAKINDNWEFTGDIQYNTKSNKTNKSQSKIDYQFSKNQTIQLNHRYTRNVSGNRLEQLSLLSNVNIDPNWQIVGQVTQDLQNKRSLESYLGVQYSSCCWGIRLSFHRAINSTIDETQSNLTDIDSRDEFDSGFKLKFVYNGVNSSQTSDSISDMFNSSIFGYKRPYFLNN
ncbi:LPS assembly protein LptD [Pseudocolwellia sp. AS88]|uniref:LPS assembly protein LptD n=1 Tax=Pseudocolwellia sp. AS88 TaxID=3063958 RepID=UPI0026EF2D8C|nr:LPS assembly protein LptD [Pseudocolwellia sp. AS88]MDO7084358.1 LPS assembly protein LptD [Pseudocolwellia sp. AS88]